MEPKEAGDKPEELVSAKPTESKEEYMTPAVSTKGIDPVELAKQLEQLGPHESSSVPFAVEATPERTSLRTSLNATPEVRPSSSHGKRLSFHASTTKEAVLDEPVLLALTRQGLPGRGPTTQSPEPPEPKAAIYRKEKEKLKNVLDDIFRNVSYEQFFQNYIQNNEVVVFAKSTCMYSEMAHNLLVNNNVEHVIVNLDLLGDHSEEVHEALKKMTGFPTVPNIFISQKHIGGYTDLRRLFTTGAMARYLRRAFDPYDYDLVVIGGGSGGLAAALEAAKFQIKIALCDYVEPTPLGTTWGLGGTCVNVGCIPKRIMHYAAHMGEVFHDAVSYGWKGFDGATHDWGTLIEGVQDYIKSLNWSYRKKLRTANIDYFNSRAKFIDAHSVSLENKDPENVKLLTSKCFIIAVGCRPKYPNFPGAKEHCISSDDFFSLKDFPGKTLVIGGSYIALECAGILNHLGMCVTVMVRSILLRGFDRGMVQKLQQHLEACGVLFVKRCVPVKVTKNDTAGYHVEGAYTDTNNKYEGNFDTVMIAMGRKPNTAHLGLRKIGVKVDPTSRRILSDRCEQTNIKHIFAIGDVAEGRPQLTPVAIKAGKLLVQRLFGDSDQLVNYKYIPTTIFTPLEYGCVGETEESAKARFGKRVVVWHNVVEPSTTLLMKTLIGEMYMKLICHRSVSPTGGIKDRLIGFHILSYNAGEITLGFALAVKKGMCKSNFDGVLPKNAISLIYSKMVEKTD